MAEPTEQQVYEVLKTVSDPELGRDLVSLGMIKEVAVADGAVRVVVELTTPACPLKGRIKQDVERAVRTLPGVREVQVELTAKVAAGRQGPLLKQVKNIIAVGAGKGGVGKSTIAVAAAVGLARTGASVGILDADVYGPSIPKMLGIEDARPEARDEMILPVRAAGDLRVISIGLIIEPGRPVIWRGPMVHNVLRQFLEQVDWGELDYLVVDLPPGTGDAPLSLAQSIPLTGAVVVCTPQPVALADAVRALHMYRQLNIEILGIVENMSYYICPQCGRREEIFGHGGAEQAAKDLKVPFLGAIPINLAIRASGDEGEPLALFEKTDEQTRNAIEEFVRALAGQVSLRNMLKPPPQPLRPQAPQQRGENQR